ncbi:MAG: NFACT family protein, partial [Lachnospiraceae bacterium]|nr:NFACT family protein [Lachnospiraceae bacterium]
MAFDGICVAAAVKEFNEKISGGRITKIAQPEKDEIVLTVKKDAETLRLSVISSAG